MTNPTDPVPEPEDPFGGPLRHLERIAPPWAAERMTICGRELDDVGAWLPFEDARALVGKVGQRRAQFLFCQTCLSRHSFNAKTPLRWEREPAQVTADWAQRAGWSGTRDGGRIAAELLALGDLVEQHREDYERHLAIRQTPDTLAERRAAKRRGKS